MYHKELSFNFSQNYSWIKHTHKSCYSLPYVKKCATKNKNCFAIRWSMFYGWLLLQIDPKPCNPRTLQKPKRSGGYPKVFLGGLPSNVTETDLRTYFNRFGKVMEVVIMYDQEKKKSRGKCKLIFTSYIYLVNWCYYLMIFTHCH